MDRDLLLDLSPEIIGPALFPVLLSQRSFEGGHGFIEEQQQVHKVSEDHRVQRPGDPAPLSAAG
ncbi:hypothetical protein [Streptomyces sp. NPDC051286]|uniref:hypothetical protein n=1 Tax=Streptomyces sp. NPDC051286 TaxID=3365647 RepID=UPI0037BE0F1E